MQLIATSLSFLALLAMLAFTNLNTEARIFLIFVLTLLAVRIARVTTLRLRGPGGWSLEVNSGGASSSENKSASE